MYRTKPFHCLIVASISLAVHVLATAKSEDAIDARSNGSKLGASQSDNLSSLYTAIEARCGPKLEGASKSDRTVSDRLYHARAALACIDRVGARAQLGAASLNESIRVKSLVGSLRQDYEYRYAVAKSEDEFLGLKWGIGLGVSSSSSQAVNNATIVDGVVRVTESAKEQPRLLFEFHRYFWCNDDERVGTRGCGPFVAVAASQERVLSGVGFGFMYGAKTAETEPDGFSVGVGAILDAKVKDLGNGFSADAAPPNSETSVRFSTKSRWSVVLFVTRTF